MYRVIAVAGAALALAACSSSNTEFSQYFRNEPLLETVRFESQPPGAEAKTSTGKSCQTPCALALPGDKPFEVTFTLAGFQPAAEKVEAFPMGDGTTKLRPNPILAELTPLAPPKKMRRPHRRVRRHHRAPAKRAAKPAMRKPAAPKPAPAKPAAAPPPSNTQTQSPSPWPAAPPPPPRQ